MRAKLCSPQAKWKRIEMRKKFEDFFWFLSSPTKCLLCFLLFVFLKTFLSHLYFSLLWKKKSFFLFPRFTICIRFFFFCFSVSVVFLSDQLKMENKFMKCDTLGYPKPCINVETRDTKILGK